LNLIGYFFRYLFQQFQLLFCLKIKIYFIPKIFTIKIEIIYSTKSIKLIYSKPLKETSTCDVPTQVIRL
jgi:hypothetical protein